MCLRSPLCPPSDPFAKEDNYVRKDKPRSSRNKLTCLPLVRSALCNRNLNFRPRLHHVKVSTLAPGAIIQNCLGSGSDSTAYRSGLFGFAIIFQHYNTVLHCSFCVMSCCHVFSFIDVLLLSYYILLCRMLMSSSVANFI